MMRKVLVFLLVSVVVLSVAGTSLAAGYWPWSAPEVRGPR